MLFPSTNVTHVFEGTSVKFHFAFRCEDEANGFFMIEFWTYHSQIFVHVPAQKKDMGTEQPLFNLRLLSYSIEKYKIAFLSAIRDRESIDDTVSRLGCIRCCADCGIQLF
jgi:hypothetical protein